MSTTETLNDVQLRATEELRANGITSFRFDELFGDELWQAMLDDIAPWVAECEEEKKTLGEQPAGKGSVIWRRFFDKHDEELPVFPLDSPTLRIAASEELLGIVNTYREQQTEVFYLDNWFTVNYPKADGRVASQRWHRDPEDEHVVKLFVYLSDVDDGAGPFEYVRSSTTGGKYGDLYRWGVEKGWYPPTEELEAQVDADDRLVMRGPAGTVVLADTGGFHRGGFARTAPRVLAVATYLQPSLKGKYADPRLRFSGDDSGLPEAVRFALPPRG